MSSGHFDSEAQRERRTEHFGLLNLLPNKTRIKTSSGFARSSERTPLQDHIPTKQGLRRRNEIEFYLSCWFNYKTISQQNKDEEMSSGHFDSEAQRERRTEHFWLLNLLSNKTRIKTTSFILLIIIFSYTKRPHPNKTRIKTRLLWFVSSFFVASKRPHPNKTRIKTLLLRSCGCGYCMLKDHIPTKQGLRLRCWLPQLPALPP